MVSKSEALFQRKPYQVAPQQRDIDKLADFGDAKGRTYAIWKAETPGTAYLDDFVKDQLQGTENKGATALFVALHKAEDLPDAGDTITVYKTHPMKKAFQFKVLEVHRAAPPYRRARKTALVIVR